MYEYVDNADLTKKMLFITQLIARNTRHPTLTDPCTILTRLFWTIRARQKVPSATGGCIKLLSQQIDANQQQW